MANREKMLMKMRSNPNDWRIEQLESIASWYGVVVRKTGGSHVVFDHPANKQLLCVPAKRPVKPIYVKRFVEFIDYLEKNNEQARLSIYHAEID